MGYELQLQKVLKEGVRDRRIFLLWIKKVFFEFIVNLILPVGGGMKKRTNILVGVLLYKLQTVDCKL